MVRVLARGRHLWRVVAVLLLVVLPARAPAQALDRLSLHVDGLEGPGFAVHDITFAFDARGASAALSIGRLHAGALSLRALELRCAKAALSVSGLICRDARARADGRLLPVVFDVEADLRTQRIRLVATPDGGGRIELSHAGEEGLRARFVDLPAAVLRGFLSTWAPQLARHVDVFKPAGVLNGELDWAESRAGDGRLALRVRVDEVAFGTADGLQAGEDIALEAGIDARRVGAAWQWRATLDWQGGAAYVHPLFIEAGPRLHAEGRLVDGRLRVGQARLYMDGVRQLSVTLDADLGALDAVSAVVDIEGADLAVIGPRWLAPLIAPAQVEQLRFSGHAGARLNIQSGRLQAVEADLDAMGFGLTAASGGAGMALGPVSGRIQWARGQRGGARLEVEGGRWEKLALGAFVLEAELGADAVRIPSLRVPVLDGALVVDALALSLTENGWQGGGSLVIEPVSMPELTAALDLPIMAGVLSASLPGLRVTPGELALDGALVISVFDGYLRATGLRLREPFGVASHLSADLEARNIDLAQLTEAFSFGSISGYIDADLRGLELARWRPVAFDARIASSPGDYRRRISQRAVENISALGGAGAMAAIQRSLLGVFETFGYREIGLHCRLAGGVCLMDGIEGGGRADGGFVIVRGGGVPALDVIGYNRRVDWKELVDRLQRVVAENVAPEVR